MTPISNDTGTHLAFSVHENKGVYALLLGSGVSRSAEIPTGWEITLDLVRKAAVAKGEASQPDWNVWYQDKFKCEPNYSHLLAELTTTASERRKILESYIEPTVEEKEEGKKLPTKAHHAIAKLVTSGHVKVIITTNFDRLMENALRDAGIEPTIISSEDSLQGAEPLTHARCYLLKLHGDYKDQRILNTDEELASYPASYDQLLDRIFDEYGLIICGWSGDWDHALKSAILRAPNRRYPTYWATRGDLSVEASRLALQRAAKSVQIAGADQFFEELQGSVETIASSSKANPLSTQLLVNSAKKFVATHEHRVNLSDLLSRETERLFDALDGEDFDYDSDPSHEEFGKRVSRYESCVEPLACTVGVLGRWGAENEFREVLELLQALLRQSETPTGGMRIWRDINRYPSVLLLTSYCMGLVKARNWKLFAKMLRQDLGNSRHGGSITVFHLFPGAWEGGNKEVWDRLPEFKGIGKKTPLSNHLLSVLGEWLPSFVGSDPNYQLLFARFEVIGALINFDSESLASLESSVAANPQGRISFMPVGQASWDSESGDALRKELESDNFQNELKASGFLEQGDRMMELFLKNLYHHQNIGRW